MRSHENDRREREERNYVIPLELNKKLKSKQKILLSNTTGFLSKNHNVMYEIPPYEPFRVPKSSQNNTG